MKLLQWTELRQAEKFMKEAQYEAQKWTCLRAHWWSVVVSDDEVIWRWHNSLPCDIAPHECIKNSLAPWFKSDKTCCIHAEQRAIIDALKTHPDKVAWSSLYFVRVDENGDVEHAWKPFCTICSKMALDVWVKIFTLFHETWITAYETEEYNNISFAYNGDT